MHESVGDLGVETPAGTGKTEVVSKDEIGDANETLCTAIDKDWGQDRPNMLMHPPCACPRCAPDEAVEVDERSWVQLYGRTQRMRVEPAELGETGRTLLG